MVDPKITQGDDCASRRMGIAELDRRRFMSTLSALVDGSADACDDRAEACGATASGVRGLASPSHILAAVSSLIVPVGGVFRR
jgi:hypothetical protein